MQPTQTLQAAMVAAMAEDTAFLAAATAMHVHLVIEPFAPSLALVLGDVTLATFPGSDPLSAGTGAQPVLTDPLTGLLNIRILEPAGGWSWVADDTVVTPETVYGWILTDTANTGLLGSGLLETPVTIEAEGQGLEIPSIKLQFSNTSPF
jgi:hypothetical protein